MHDEANVRPELRSFGRRRGRKMSPRQDGLLAALLPRVAISLDAPAPASLLGLFDVQVGDVWLEIGFGGGEHLLWQARHHSDVGIVGCEPFLDGVVKVLSALDREPAGNVRLFADDARPLLRWLPEASVGRAFILFPDPWPKTRHQKRRLVSEATVRDLARALRPGSELRIATDIGDYAKWMLLALRAEGSFRWTAQTAADWRQRPDDWPATRYEAKALREGRRCSYFRFVRS
jgi:tRNA (guanine-N7-)-methyltransferase